MDSDQTFYASVRLKVFMVAVRLLGLVLALILTGLNSEANLCSELPFKVEGFSIVLTLAVVLYNVVAAFFVFKTENHGFAPLTIAVIDYVFGMILTYYYGPGYLILSFTVPLLMLCYI
ncbi:hypothetical protein IJT10_04390, partial [bacterium]|nr:hypothetical protein [bacterium]